MPKVMAPPSSSAYAFLDDKPNEEAVGGGVIPNSMFD
jgi:hypothetical protein